jgi:hypothetical protein
MHIMLGSCVAYLRVQKISFTQTILEECLVNSIFHKTKIQTMDMKVVAYSIFPKNERGNSQRPFSKPRSSCYPPFWADMVNLY